MSALEEISIDISVVLGSTMLPIRQVLRMGRGSMIPLDCGHEDPSLVFANDVPVARGKILVDGDHISLEVTQIIRKDAQ